MSLTATLTSAWSVALPFADAQPKLTDAGNTQLLLAALAGIAAVVLLISWAKFHPFLALIIGAAVMGGVAGVQPADIVTSFTKGLGSTTGSVGLLIALGAMIGKLLQDSGGSETIVDRLIGGVSPRRLPWMMALIAFILGIPLFFEVGVVLLVPVVILVARKLDLSLMKVGIPALAGLSILHGFVPPHPGPLLAIDIVKADLSTVLLYGLVISVPTLIVSGPLLARFVDQWVPVHASGAPGGSDAGPTHTQTHSQPQTSASEAPRLTKRPGFVPAVLSITLPVILMLLRAIGELTLDEENGVRKFLEFLGTPAVALLLGVLVSMFFLGFRTGMNRSQVEKSVGSALPGIAGILLIVAAGGGFKQMLVDAGVGAVIGDLAKGSGLSPLILGWLIAVGIRLATGSATVATITAAGIVSPLAAGLDKPTLALLVLAVGAGSLFFSHVNDAGFWLVKEYFGLTIGQTIKSWSVMETVISVAGLIFVLLFSLVV
ncbi:L-idonate and D-gluconate transporter [Phycicoccus elongatus Lp2]|uniref:L-idonate and D-gluconate transporter n=1 Tax=Phycicoccus elongatus Lp2 TaxID=1193181 RepID=N0E2R1_9MICO|nr:gluconate:H+ symporter [Phycicoccus elongatus]CCH70025.1 L-idonate and D-gluconate transporter [Phycicoccus elongatus Lp2]